MLLSSYSGCQGLSSGRCAQLSAAHVKPGADSTTCSAHEWRDTGEVFSALQSGDDSATGGSTGQMAAAVDAAPRRALLATAILEAYSASQCLTVSDH